MIYIQAVLQTPGVFRFEGGVRSAVGVIDQMSSVIGLLSDEAIVAQSVFLRVVLNLFLYVSVFDVVYRSPAECIHADQQAL